MDAASEPKGDETSDLIARADRWLAANRPDYHARLRPGVADAALDAFEARFSLRLPDAFRAFYRWRDGQDRSCYDSLIGDSMFLSLDVVADTKAMLDGMIGDDFEDPRWWRTGWIPFLDNFHSDHLCLDLTAEDGGTPGQLVQFWHEHADRPVRRPDFETWLRSLVDAMESGVLELDQDEDAP